MRQASTHNFKVVVALFLLYLVTATTANIWWKIIQGKKLFAEVQMRLAKITPNNFHDKTKFRGVPALHGFLFVSIKPNLFKYVSYFPNHYSLFNNFVSHFPTKILMYARVFKGWLPVASA